MSKQEMRRPRIALWIKWRRPEWERRWFIPKWVWRWAMQCVDTYREEQDRIARAYIRAEAPKIREGFAKLAKLRKELGG